MSSGRKAEICHSDSNSFSPGKIVSAFPPLKYVDPHLIMPGCVDVLRSDTLAVQTLPLCIRLFLFLSVRRGAFYGIIFLSYVTLIQYFTASLVTIMSHGFPFFKANVNCLRLPFQEFRLSTSLANKINETRVVDYGSNFERHFFLIS